MNSRQFCLAQDKLRKERTWVQGLACDLKPHGIWAGISSFNSIKFLEGCSSFCLAEVGVDTFLFLLGTYEHRLFAPESIL